MKGKAFTKLNSTAIRKKILCIQWHSPFFPLFISTALQSVHVQQKKKGGGDTRSIFTSLSFPVANKILLFSEDTPVNFQFRFAYQEIGLSLHPLEIIPGLRFHTLTVPQSTLTTCFLCQSHPNVVLDKSSTSRLFTLPREYAT